MALRRVTVTGWKALTGYLLVGSSAVSQNRSQGRSFGRTVVRRQRVGGSVAFRIEARKTAAAQGSNDPSDSELGSHTSLGLLGFDFVGTIAKWFGTRTPCRQAGSQFLKSDCSVENPTLHQHAAAC